MRLGAARPVLPGFPVRPVRRALPRHARWITNRITNSPRGRPVDLDPAVVPIPDDVQGDADEWLHSLRRDAEPVELDVTGAELIAEARDEAG